MIHMVYGDVSEGDGYLTAGAYLGKEHEWLNATKKWSDALDDAGVKEFRATNFFNARGQFDDDRWRRKEGKGRMIPGGELHDTFAKRFTSIAVDSGLVGFAYSIDVEAFAEFLSPVLVTARRKYHDGDPKTRAIMNCLASVGNWLTQTCGYREKNSLQVIFEHEHGAGKFVDFFNETKQRKERWTYCFKSFTTEGKWLVPLQMADLLAHECWRRSRQQRDNPNAKLRKSFQRMLGDGKISLQYLNREHCKENAIISRDILGRYPDGLIPAEDQRPIR